MMILALLVIGQKFAPMLLAIYNIALLSSYF